MPKTPQVFQCVGWSAPAHAIIGPSWRSSLAAAPMDCLHSLLPCLRSPYTLTLKGFTVLGLQSGKHCINIIVTSIGEQQTAELGLVAQSRPAAIGTWDDKLQVELPVSSGGDVTFTVEVINADGDHAAIAAASYTVEASDAAGKAENVSLVAFTASSSALRRRLLPRTRLRAHRCRLSAHARTRTQSTT